MSRIRQSLQQQQGKQIDNKKQIEQSELVIKSSAQKKK
jgi:hypothetical protein